MGYSFNKAKFFQVRIFFHENNNMYLIFISIIGVGKFAHTLSFQCMQNCVRATQ